MISSGERVIAAVSGGADSVCMLMLLKELSCELGFSLEAVHVEHGIRGAESRADADFTGELCNRLDVPCHVCPVDVPAYAQKTGLGLEEAARILRYDVFEKIARSHELKDMGKEHLKYMVTKVAVAHHEEDNAETVLFQMIRGSGVKGLTGIHPLSEKNGVTYIRPLLFASRADIEEYLEKNSQKYVIDATNLDTDYSRNKLRHEVFPMLAQINDRAVEHINESARQLDVMYDFYEEQLKDVCGKAIHRTGNGVELDIVYFDSLHPALKSGVARECIHLAAGRLKDIGSVHINKLIELTGMQSGRSINLPYGIVATRSYDLIILTVNKTCGVEDSCGRKNNQPGGATCGSIESDTVAENMPSLTETVHVSTGQLAQIAASGEKKTINMGKKDESISLEVFDFNGKMDEIPKKPYTKWLDYDKMKKGFEIRNRRAGDYIVVDDKGHHKKLKAFFIDEKVPAAQRDRIWLIARESQILSIMGYRSAQDVLVTDQTKEVLKITFYGGERNGFFKEI